MKRTSNRSKFSAFVHIIVYLCITYLGNLLKRYNVERILSTNCQSRISL